MWLGVRCGSHAKGMLAARGGGCWSRLSGRHTARDARGPTWRESSRRLGSLVGGSAPAVPSGRKWKGSQSSESATELGFPRPALWQMQGRPAGRAGKPSGQGEEPSPEGLGGCQLLAQTDARRPASQVMRHHLDCQPGGVGGETARLRDLRSLGILN